MERELKILRDERDKAFGRWRKATDEHFFSDRDWSDDDCAWEKEKAVRARRYHTAFRSFIEADGRLDLAKARAEHAKKLEAERAKHAKKLETDRAEIDTLRVALEETRAERDALRVALEEALKERARV
jgi:hypothetical protein